MSTSNPSPLLQGFGTENNQSHGGEPVGSAGWNLGAGKEIWGRRWQDTGPLPHMIRGILLGPRGPAGNGWNLTHRPLRQKEPAVPALKDLLPQGVPEALSDTKNPSSEGEANNSQHTGGGPREAPAAGKSAAGPGEVPPEEPPQALTWPKYNRPKR